MKKFIFGVICFSSLLLANDKVISWKCKFPIYSDENGLQKVKKFDLAFKLDTITNKAYMEGNNGLADVVPIFNSSDTSITFVEVTGSKNVMITTVAENGKAVHSRNTVMFKKLVPSQYYGTCEVK